MYVKLKLNTGEKTSTDNIIVLSAFAIYLAIMIIIGFVCSKNTNNNEDYFLGGRNLGGWTAAISAQASDMSGWLLMGLQGSVYFAGTGEIWITIGLLIGTILNRYLVSARLRNYTIAAGNSLTIPNFFQNRYRDEKGIIKIVSTLIIAIFFAVYTASAFSSGAKLFAILFGDGSNSGTVYIIGLCIAAFIILVYTFMGGFKAICVTDLVQGMLMLVAIMAVPILAYTILTYDTGFGSALEPVILLALFRKRSTLAGAVSGMATGALTVIIWDYIPLVDGMTLYKATNLYPLVLGFAFALIVNVIVSLITKKPSKEIQDEFDSIKTLEI